MDLYIMFRIQCMDAVPLQAMPLQHPGRAAGKYRQAVGARLGEWSTGSSSSSGGEDKKSKIQEASGPG